MCIRDSTKRKGTESAASNVVSYIESNIYNKKHCIGVFLDISSAFDTIRPEHIKEEMYTRTDNEDLIEWYYNYLMHRNMYFDLQGSMKTVSNSLGFPQGGVASAKMWLIAFNKAIEIINSHGIYGVGFADDCYALVGGTNLGYMVHKLQKVLNELTAWGKSVGLSFNEKKTVVIHFTRTKQAPKHYLKMNNKNIENSKSCTYLGLTIHSMLLEGIGPVGSTKNEIYFFYTKIVH